MGNIGYIGYKATLELTSDKFSKILKNNRTFLTDKAEYVYLRKRREQQYYFFIVTKCSSSHLETIPVFSKDGNYEYICVSVMTKIKKYKLPYLECIGTIGLHSSWNKPEELQKQMNTLTSICKGDIIDFWKQD